MSLRAPAPCLHELRPGTKVCLHCRRAEREARAAHRNRILGRVVVCAIGLGVAVAGAKAGFDAYQRGALPRIPDLMAATTKAIVESLPAAPAASAASAAAPLTVSGGPSVGDSAPAVLAASDSTVGAPGGAAIDLSPIASNVAGPGQTGPVAAPTGGPALVPAVTMPVPLPANAAAPLPAPIPPAAVTAAAASGALTPVVAQGRTELAGGMFAIRAGDTVTVHFDTPEARTRRPEKFEQIVRATLPQVHGDAAQTMLAAITAGALIGPVDLVNELPVRGLHLRSSDGRTLSLWPETRPGRDGPLVVAYRAVTAR